MLGRKESPSHLPAASDLLFIVFHRDRRTVLRGRWGGSGLGLDSGNWDWTVECGADTDYWIIGRQPEITHKRTDKKQPTRHLFLLYIRVDWRLIACGLSVS